MKAIIYYSLILATLLIFSGMISGSEVALFSLSKSQLKNEDKSSHIQIIQKLLSKVLQGKKELFMRAK